MVELGGADEQQRQSGGFKQLSQAATRRRQRARANEANYPTCSECGQSSSVVEFSANQKRKQEDRKCTACVQVASNGGPGGTRKAVVQHANSDATAALQHNDDSISSGADPRCCSCCGKPGHAAATCRHRLNPCPFCRTVGHLGVACPTRSRPGSLLGAPRVPGRLRVTGLSPTTGGGLRVQRHHPPPAERCCGSGQGSARV
jgi:hypothetical protein